MSKKKRSGEKQEARTLSIRRATAWDVVNLAKMLLKAHGEQASSIWYPPVAEGDKGRMMVLRHATEVIDRGVCYVADLHNRLVGTIGFAIDRVGWSEQWQLTNEWYYVIPQFRDSDIAVALMHAAQHFADSDFIPNTEVPKQRLPMIMGNVSGERTGLKNEFLKQLGFQYGGGNFMRAPSYEPDQQDTEADAA